MPREIGDADVGANPNVASSVCDCDPRNPPETPREVAAGGSRAGAGMRNAAGRSPRGVSNFRRSARR